MSISSNINNISIVNRNNKRIRLIDTSNFLNNGLGEKIREKLLNRCLPVSSCFGKNGSIFIDMISSSETHDCLFVIEKDENLKNLKFHQGSELITILDKNKTVTIKLPEKNNNEFIAQKIVDRMISFN